MCLFPLLANSRVMRKVYYWYSFCLLLFRERALKHAALKHITICEVRKGTEISAWSVTTPRDKFQFRTLKMCVARLVFVGGYKGHPWLFSGDLWRIFFLFFFYFYFFWLRIIDIICAKQLYWKKIKDPKWVQFLHFCLSHVFSH